MKLIIFLQVSKKLKPLNVPNAVQTVSQNLNIYFWCQIEIDDGNKKSLE